MKILVSAMAIAGLALNPTYAADFAGRWASSSNPAAGTITALEEMWAHTSCSPAPPALKAAFAEDFQGTAPNGHLYGRPKNWGKYGHDLDCKLEKIRIRLFGDSVAIAYGEESGVSAPAGGKEQKYCLVWTDTWLKRNGKWQILAAQDTGVPCP